MIRSNLTELSNLFPDLFPIAYNNDGHFRGLEIFFHDVLNIFSSHSTDIPHIISEIAKIESVKIKNATQLILIDLLQPEEFHCRNIFAAIIQIEIIH